MTEAPAVKYVVYRAAGNPDARVIEQRNHNLDVINDITPEGMFSIMKDNATVAAWVETFPFAHPDPTLPSVLINHKVAPFDNKDVRWALALLIDIRAVALGSYRGAANLAALGVPPTGSAPTDYYEPMQEWLINFELDTGTRKIKPYDPNIATELADMVRPTWGDAIPTDEAQLKRVFGYGWWKQDLTAAAELLTRAGFTKQGNRWMKPDGTPFAFRVQVEGDAIPTLARAGTVIAQQWQEFGIDAKVVVAGPTHGQLLGSGDFDTAIAWTIETWGGHPDMSFFLESYPLGLHQAARRGAAAAQPAALGRPASRRDHRSQPHAWPSTRPKSCSSGIDYLKLAVEEMPMIPLMAYNKFAPFDTTYWTGYPSIDNPYAASGPNWSNLRYMIVALKPNPDAPKS